MSICLAATWFPRGEWSRFSRLLPELEQVYSRLVIVLIPGADRITTEQLVSPLLETYPKETLHTVEDPRQGRYMALRNAVDTDADFIHYVDMDRLLRWVETRPVEWRTMVGEIEKHDCVIFGRSPAAYDTHPQSLVSTEKISNTVVSHFLNREMDVSAGSKSFSSAAAQYIVDHGKSDDSMGTDAEWPILLDKAGFRQEYIQVDGLDWETGDQYQSRAISAAEQEKAALVYDQNPANWLHRAKVAQQIIQAALEVVAKPHPGTVNVDALSEEFNFEAVFEVDDYLYFYSQDLTDERTEMEANAVVSLLGLNKPKVILDLACGFGRHTNRLAALGHKMTGVDISPGFLEIARRDALHRHVDVNYLQCDMRDISFNSEFDCVLLLFTAFGYFSEEENLKVLINVRNALHPGGRLLFDVPNRDTFQKTVRPFYVHEKESNLMIDRITFDGVKGRSYNRRIVIRDGVLKDKPFSIRLYNPTEIRWLIRQAGLEMEHFYGGWDAQDLTAESGRLVVIARKPGKL